MNAKRYDRSKMGISGALVAILLVVVAIALVGVAWAVLSGYLGTASVKADVAIEKLDLVANGQSVLVIRNTGNVRITSLDATLTCNAPGVNPNDPQLSSFSNLDPGQTFSEAWDAGDLVPGDTCTLTITGTAANGASVAASASAIVRP